MKDSIKLTIIALTLLSFLNVTPAAASPGTAVLTTSEDWRYAMMASSFAAANGYPLLLTPGNALDSSVKDNLKGFTKVYIIGGTQVVSKGIEDEINDLRLRIVEGYWGIRPVRIGGDDIFETSAAVADKWLEVDGAVIVRDDIFPDTLVGTQLSAVLKAPMLFTKTDSLPSATLEKIKSFTNSANYPNGAVIIGGTAAVSAGVESAIKDTGITVERIGGADRFETSTLVAERFIQELGVVNTAIFTDNENYEGALSLGLKAYNEKAPILYTSSLVEVVAEFLAQHTEITHVIINIAPGEDSGDIVESIVEVTPNVAKVEVVSPAAISDEDVTALETLLEARGVTWEVTTEVSDVEGSVSVSESLISALTEVAQEVLSGGGGGGAGNTA